MLRLIFITVILIFEVKCAPTTINPLTAETETISLEGLDYLLRHAENLFLRELNRHSENQQKSSYLQPPIDKNFNFYLPLFSTQDNQKLDLKTKNLLKFSPPEKTNDQINYYAAKPKKIPKKFSSNVKHVNIKPASTTKLIRQGKNFKGNDEWEAMLGNVNQEDSGELQNQQAEQIIFDDSYFGVDSHIPVPEVVGNEPQSNQNQGVRTSQQQKLIDSKTKNEEVNLQPAESQKSDRIEYQMHGFAGPKSYKFGYDTGHGKNRQFRFEERDRDGNVVGEYGYFDKMGKIKLVKYSASPETGFQTEHYKK